MKTSGKVAFIRAHSAWRPEHGLAAWRATRDADLQVKGLALDMRGELPSYLFMHIEARNMGHRLPDSTHDPAQFAAAWRVETAGEGGFGRWGSAAAGRSGVYALHTGSGATTVADAITATRRAPGAA